MKTEQLARFESALERADAPVMKRLAVGASDAQLTDIEEGFGFPLPGDLRLLWKWHDGLSEPPQSFVDISLVPSGPEFLSAAASLRRYQEYRGVMAEIAPRLDAPLSDPDVLFHPRWVPVFDAHPGLFVCDCSSDTAGPILYVEPALAEIFLPQVPSLGQLIEWLTDAYENGAWTHRDTEHWVRDRSRIPQERRDAANRLLS